MLLYFKHAVNIVKHAVRDIGTGATRSGQWKTVEKHFLEQHPTCEACGTTENLNVHHIKPFHIHPELELDPNNLMTMCMKMGKECHLLIAHGGSFRSYCENVRDYAHLTLNNPNCYELIVARAKLNRVPN